MRLLLLWSEEVELSLRSALALLWLLLWLWFWLLVVVLLLLLPPLPEAADLAEEPADGEAEPPVGGPAPEEDFPGEDRLLPPPAVIPDLRLLGLALLLAWPPPPPPPPPAPPPPDLSPLTLWKYKSDPLCRLLKLRAPCGLLGFLARRGLFRLRALWAVPRLLPLLPGPFLPTFTRAAPPLTPLPLPLPPLLPAPLPRTALAAMWSLLS